MSPLAKALYANSEGNNVLSSKRRSYAT